ncbi:MAG: M23 family metallopeptidase [Candidatus Sungbacteria bacterium]|nr:M23 family metallopeptidase [Candidatus Sungbacteria bacterium]
MDTRLRVLFFSATVLLLVGCASVGDLGATAGGSVCSRYASSTGANGQCCRPGLHAGVDFCGTRGDLILAAAGGKVLAAVSPPGCGICVLVEHEGPDDPFSERPGRYTLYAHLDEALVKRGDVVRRGQPVGRMGDSGYGARGVVHLHWQYCTRPCYYGNADGDLRNTDDPMQYYGGCFDPAKVYPAGKFVLTRPLKC